MVLEFSDTTNIELPPTLKVDKVRTEPDSVPVRAPFSTIQIVAGDGKLKPEPFTISGKAYFADTAAANSWIFSLKEKIFTARRLYIDDVYYTLFAADLVVVPSLLPRILSVTIKVYPSSVVPVSVVP